MGYQALLFCTEEKLSRVVTQVFTELEFNVEPVSEPFSAVKKLMAQHYDAIVVDCENEQNASLLFKSARNSSANQSSLALALVEGQAGVAKAYRIGANLVLTKPINVEQAKGTLRVARGLLRKSADAAASTASQSSSAPASTAIVPPVSAAKQETANVKPAAFTAPPAGAKGDTAPQSENASPAADRWPEAHPESVFAAPAFKSEAQPLTASAKAGESTPSVSEPPTAIFESADAPVIIDAPQISKPAATPASQDRKPSVTFGSLPGAAAAPAPAKEIPVPSKAKATATDLFEGSSAKVQPAEVVAAPTFSALEETSEGSGSSKKFVAIAALIAIAVGLGYFGWTKFGRTSTDSQSPSAMQTAQPTSTPVPTSPAALTPSTVTRAATAMAPAPSSTGSVTSEGRKPQAGFNSAPITKIAVGPEETAKPEVVTKTFEPPAIHVKIQASAPKVQRPADEGSVPVPDPLGVGSSKDANLASLVSGTANLPAAPTGTLRISQGVSQGLLIKKVQPVYPLNAKSMRVEGAVEMEALIDKEGKITNLKVLKGQAVLARAAVDAVKQWRYKPYYLNGQPVEIQTQITVVFKLPN